MIRPAFRYCKEDIWPRLPQIVFNASFIIALLLAIGCGLFGEYLLPDTTKVLDVGMALLTYAAIAQGFCLAGLTLLLTLPDQEFLLKLADHRDAPGEPDAYSNLLFVFSWSAVLHWVLLVVAVFLLILAGSEKDVWSATPSLRYRIVGGAVCGLSFYSFFQFFIALITIIQVSKVSIALRQGMNKKA